MILFGFYPAPLLRIMNPVLETIAARLDSQAAVEFVAFIGQALPSILN